VIVINADSGETFKPRAHVPSNALSPADAWAYWDRNKPIPADVRVQYGKLSHFRIFRDRSVFAFSLPHTLCDNSNPNYSPPPNLECTEWTFLNPFTGRHIESTYVEEPLTPSP
jgi:hypothetical protein